MADDNDRLIPRTLVPPNKKVKLEEYPTSWKDCDDLDLNGLVLSKENADKILERSREELERVQELLWAESSHSMLMILQGMDAAGKDGIIEHVMSGVNPQGCQVTGFKVPSAKELGHDFLWRCYGALPERGMIGIFNRSYYEEVLVVRVHPELLEQQRLPGSKKGKDLWQERYESINDIERHLVRNGTAILKFFLHESLEEQKERFLARLDDPKKQWKFNPADIKERDLWDDYTKAYEKMLSATSTEEAPWYIIPADQKWLARTLISSIMARTIESLHLQYPQPSKEVKKALDEAKKRLKEE
ncbi:MAG TPA: polyphosphate kinase 2 family protein [Methanomassiliicoccales archaeon]|jgi:PPK2 family polyphosphate:nucleotide phosphotransferase